MKPAVILWGVGEIGGVLARGFLRLGHPVVPVNRGDDPQAVAQAHPQPALVVIAVGEAALPAVLRQVPDWWKDRLLLLQNELLPMHWQQAGLEQPTVVSVWFEKKPGKGPLPLLPSPVFGPHAQLLSDALQAVGLEARILPSEQALLEELVLKNLYILTTNIGGLRQGGTTGTCWAQHRDFACALAREILQLQEALAGTTLDEAALLEGMEQAFLADPDHACMGRSAPARLQRVLEQAERLGIAMPLTREIAQARA